MTSLISRRQVLRILGTGVVCLTVLPDESKTITFKAMYHGAFTYHCGISGEMDVHIARGIHGTIVVEPEEGLSRVDRAVISSTCYRPTTGRDTVAPYQDVINLGLATGISADRSIKPLIRHSTRLGVRAER